MKISNGSCCTDAIAVQKDHDLANDLLIRPSICNALGANRTNSGDLTKPTGLGLDDIEDFFAKRLHHLLGIDRPNPADHSRAKVLFDAVD